MPDSYTTFATLAFAWVSMLILVQADTVVQDPMEAQANSFGWLAIRNFTYCLSSHPDPPDKPRGVQPKFSSLDSLDTGEKRLTGMGDSVVVLYHPENTNKAIAWCNTLVAFQSTRHVQCHTALPTCQRCEAVRSKNSTIASVAAAQSGRDDSTSGGKKGSKAPSKKFGQNVQPQQKGTITGQKSNKETVGTVASDYSDLVALRRRGIGNKDPNDPWVPLPGTEDDKSQPQPQSQSQPQSESQPQAQPQTQPSSQTEGASQPPKGTVPRTFGSLTTASDINAENDPELEAAISEFQDYCENKLTLAVRADCPLHIVRHWSDEPPFDLQRFCMSMLGSDGSTLHTGSAGTRIQGQEAADGKGGTSSGNDQLAAPGRGNSNLSGGQSGMVGQTDENNEPKGVVDPNDPVIPPPDDTAGGQGANAGGVAGATTQPKPDPGKASQHSI